ncbi:MAG: hypothetical protein ACHQQQ_07485 [Bacteroidota bacterium]
MKRFIAVTIITVFGIWSTAFTGDMTVHGNLSVTNALNFGFNTRQMINLYDITYGIGVQNYTLYQRTSLTGSFAWYAGGIFSPTPDDPGTGGHTLMTLDATGSLTLTQDLNLGGGFTMGSAALGSSGIVTIYGTRVYPALAPWRLVIDNTSTSIGGYLSLEQKRTFIHGFDSTGYHWFSRSSSALPNNELMMGLHQKGLTVYDLHVNGTVFGTKVSPDTSAPGGVVGVNSLSYEPGVIGRGYGANGSGISGFGLGPGSTGVYGTGTLWAGYFDGKVSVCTLEIRGGCDLAEPFHMSSPEVCEGDVVIIDDQNPGNLKLSSRAYDQRVAGIVSGANGITPGIALRQDGALAGGKNVALTGRVYVLADDSNGPIVPGDLLTTSDIPGHAMKVTDHVRAQGAVIGKAMSELKEGNGMVLVLVSLQ